MQSYILRHWNGAVGTWQSLINTLVVYIISALMVAWIGMQPGSWTSLPLVILLLVLMPIVAWAVIGTIRSAIRVLENWRTQKIEALGGVVAIATNSTNLLVPA